MTLSPANSHGTVQTQITAISSAQILALDATPVTIINSPGAGFAVVPFSIATCYRFVTTPYSADGTLKYLYQGLGFDFESFSLGLDQAADYVNFGTSFAGGMLRTAAENLPVVAKLSSAVTTGDGTVKVTAWYTTVTLS